MPGRDEEIDLGPAATETAWRMESLALPPKRLPLALGGTMEPPDWDGATEPPWRDIGRLDPAALGGQGTQLDGARERPEREPSGRKVPCETVLPATLPLREYCIG